MKKQLLFKVIGNIYIWLILLFMYLPILILVAYSFASTKVIGGHFVFTWDLFPALFQNTQIMIALGNTLLIAFISGLVATLLGTLGAIGAFYSKKRVRKIYDGLTQINVVNAEIVIAFSLTVMFVFLGTFVFKNDLFSFWTLLIGHVAISVPFVFISVKPKLEQMDPSLYEAAVDLGAKPSTALNRVIIPSITPGVISGFLLALTLSLDDFIVTSFTRGTGLLSGDNKIETLSTFIQAAIKKKTVPTEMRALVTIIFVLVIVSVVAITVTKYVKGRNKYYYKKRV